MPYLNNKIENHKDGCSDPSAKRLYVRDYDDKGRQRFVSYGITCPSCGVLVTEDYHHNLTFLQRKKMEEIENRLSKYDQQQRKKFEEIDKEYNLNAMFVMMGKDNKAKSGIVLEWGNKLKDAGMDQDELHIHVFTKMNGSPQDALSVKNMGHDKREKLENIFNELK